MALIVMAHTVPALEPVRLGDEHLDTITPGLAASGTFADPEAFSANSLSKLSSGSRIVKASDDASVGSDLGADDFSITNE
jgi:hypothetical protein